ncbi:MAG: FAD-dependent monooxygenase [Arenicella sp.]|nr:FAD-dependent monooxygenase [Arenicella sp.]
MVIQPKYDVVIIGAGPVGTTFANLLGKYGVKTLIVDKEQDILPIPRAIGLCEEGSRVLDAAGVLGDFDKHTVDIEAVHFDTPLGNTLFSLDVNRNKNGYREMRTFYQPQLEQFLRDSLVKFECVDLATATKCVGFDDQQDHVQLSLSANDEFIDVSCRFVVACDGAVSETRKSLDIAYRGQTYAQEWLIFDAENDLVPDKKVVFLGNKERPGVTLPAPAGRRRWEFVVKEGDDIEQLFAGESIRELLSPWGDMEQMAIERKTTYTFHARSARQFRKGNVFLVGDAAHVTPPFAGQGLMAGLRDCYNLAWKLNGVLRGTFHQRILDTYNSERQSQVRQVVSFAKFIGSMVLPQGNISTSVRDKAIKLMTLLGLFSMNQGGGMRKMSNHINGSMMRHMLIRKIRGTGYEFPQQEVIDGHGETSLIDHCLGDTFCLIAYDQHPAASMSPTLITRWQSIGGQFAIIHSSKDNSEFSADALPEATSLIDIDGNYWLVFAGNKKIIGIRPDKMIVVNSSPAGLEKRLDKYLDTLT